LQVLRFSITALSTGWSSLLGRSYEKLIAILPLLAYTIFISLAFCVDSQVLVSIAVWVSTLGASVNMEVTMETNLACVVKAAALGANLGR
jgi:hypothetical protein